jgi:hypothetical protein
MKKVIATSIVGGLLLAGLAIPSQAATTTVSAATKAKLIYIIQEEKLARDVYAAIAKIGGSQKFSNISPSEQTHLNELAAIMKVYGIADPTIGLKAGVFKDTKLTALYKTVMAKSALSAADALAVGVLIENIDIADLNADLKTITQPDIKAVLNLLLAGSQKHLAAFSR